MIQNISDEMRVPTPSTVVIGGGSGMRRSAMRRSVIHVGSSPKVYSDGTGWLMLSNELIWKVLLPKERAL
jgi:hypothetical protein